MCECVTTTSLPICTCICIFPIRITAGVGTRTGLICLSLTPFLYLSFCLSLIIFHYLYLSFSVSVCLSVCLYVSLSLCLCLYLSFQQTETSLVTDVTWCFCKAINTDNMQWIRAFPPHYFNPRKSRLSSEFGSLWSTQSYLGSLLQFQKLKIFSQPFRTQWQGTIQSLFTTARRFLEVIRVWDPLGCDISTSTEWNNEGKSVGEKDVHSCKDFNPGIINPGIPILESDKVECLSSAQRSLMILI